MWSDRSRYVAQAHPSAAKHQKCASVGCNFQVTWHATHCCGACASGAQHGPHCEQLVMPKRCATQGCAFEATWHPEYCCHACAGGQGHGGKCEQRLCADEAAQELRDLYNSFAITKGLTLVLSGEAGNQLGVTLSRARLHRTNASPALEDVSLLGLGKDFPWRNHALTVDPQKVVTKVERELVRIVVPTHYRELFVPEPGAERIPDILSDMATWGCKAHVLTGGRWERQDYQKQASALVGWLKLSAADAKTLLDNSGRKGIFTNKNLDVSSVKPQFVWIKKEYTETNHAYFQRCQKLAAERKQALCLRKGGGSDLGFPKTDKDNQDLKPKGIQISGIPKPWMSEEVSEFLTSQGWTQITLWNRRFQNRKVIWNAKALPPVAYPYDRGIWVYQAPGEFDIIVNDSIHRPVKPSNVTAVKAPKKAWDEAKISNRPLVNDKGRGRQKAKDDDKTRDRSRSPMEKKETEESDKNGAAPMEGVASTQIDPQTQQDDTGSASDKTKESKPLSSLSNLAEALEAGWTLAEQGGCGDCGYRALIDNFHFQTTGEELSQTECIRQANLFRTQIVQHIRQNHARYENHVRGGAEAFPSFCDEATKQTHWICGLLLQAAAEVKSCCVVVWNKTENDLVERFTFAPQWSDTGMPRVAKDAPILVIQREAKHYRFSLDFQEQTMQDVDVAWHKLAKDLFSTLAQAVEDLRPEVMAGMPRGLLRQGKPEAARFRPKAEVLRVATGEQASAREIRLTRQLGRLKEIRAELAQAAKDSKGTAPGLDQWTQSELQLLSCEMWDTVAAFVQHCEQVGAIPTQWKEMRQLHLSKGKNSDSVDNLRPISVTSFWWRTVQRARFQQPAAQSWIQGSMPPYVYGGIPHRGTIDAVAPLLKADAEHWWIGSLDYQKAFDRVQPRVVCDIFVHLGMPRHVAMFMLNCWGDQKRFLQFMDQFDPVPEKVSSSLLQGDPWSMFGMAAMLLPAAENVKRNHPEVIQVLYADDRTLAAGSVQQLQSAIDRWHVWGDRLGLADNRQKSQFYHATTQGRRRLVQAGVASDKVCGDIKILGYCFQGVLARKANVTESTRIQKAIRQALRVQCLPGALSRRIRLAQYVVPSKAGYGWLCRNPSKKDVQPLDGACRHLMKKPKQAAPDLYRLMRGHHWDLKFLATQCQVSVLHRYACREGAPMPANLLSKAGWPKALLKGLQDLGWIKLRQWTWRHDELNAQITLSGQNARQKDTGEVLHLLRESWRRKRYAKFCSSDRRETTLVSLPGYDEKRVKKLRTTNLSADELAVVTGAFVSPACYAIMTNSSDVPAPSYGAYAAAAARFWAAAAAALALAGGIAIYISSMATGWIDRSRFDLPGRQLLAECKPNVDRVTFTNLQFAEAQVSGVSVPLSLDLLLPSADHTRTFPCVIFCHGGSWQRGDHKRFVHSQWRDFLLSLGWAVASTQYRFLQEASFPACEADLRCAVRMLRRHARDFRLNPDMLVAFGHSAGGHLVSLLPAADVALDGDMRHLAPEVSCRPNALICLAPALKGPRKQIGNAGNAFEMVNHSWPPSLVLHGTRDHLLDAETSQEFVEKLHSLEVPAQFVLLEGHGHEVIPPPPEALAAVRDFLLQQNDVGGVPMGHRARQRLAGNGLEDLENFERFDFRDDAFEGFLTLGSSDEFPGEAQLPEPVANAGAGSSSALRRHNAWFGTRREAPDTGELGEPGELSSDLSPRMRQLISREDFGEDFAFASEHLRGNSWMTPSRRGRRKSDPVTRGAQLRELWNRDRFLRSSGNRKFDLRGCGPPQDVRRYNRHLSSPNYVPMHHKRGDEEQYQVRRQMRIPDY
eukprot:s136_g10.t1